MSRRNRAARSVLAAILLVPAGCSSVPPPAATPAPPIVRERSSDPLTVRSRPKPALVARAPAKPAPAPAPAVADPAPHDTAPRVILERPNGGNRLCAGAIEKVRWSAFDTDLADAPAAIDLSRDDGAHWDKVAQGLPGTGEYEWRVPAEPGSGYRLRVSVSDRAGHMGCDVSDEPFTVTAPDRVPRDPSPLSADLVYQGDLRGDEAASHATYRAGMQACREERREEAIMHLRAAIALDPGLAEAYTALGKVLLDLHRTDEACMELSAGLKVRETPEARVNLGVACFAKGDVPRAAEEFRRALQMAPHLPEGHLYLGMALAGLGNPEDARGHLRAAADLASDPGVAERARTALARLP